MNARTVLRNLVLFTALLAAIFLGSVISVSAQDPPPPSPDHSRIDLPASPGHGPQQMADGHWYMPAGGAAPVTSSAADAPTETGGPDDYGYTWDDSLPLSWIDASGGIDTGINNDVDRAGPIDIGFPFKFYEHTYTQLYISRYGFVAFNDENMYNDQSRIPSAERPNDVIAPYWAPVDDVLGYVRYLHGGESPDRWFAVEWNRMGSNCCGDPDEYTFEVVLHEDGSIIFQYQKMIYGGEYHWCGSAGIEDVRGLDGLSYLNFCWSAPSNKSVHFYRPAPSARVSIDPLYYGGFTHPSGTASYQISIRNTGELGSDTYDFSLASLWPMEVYKGDGVTPLSDTDGDGDMDTGPVAQGAETLITVKITAPSGAMVGDNNLAGVTVSSSLDMNRSKRVYLQTAIPASFAQVFRDDADGAMTLYLAQPAGQLQKKVTENWRYGYTPAVAETPNGFVYVWSKGYWMEDKYIAELEYVLADEYGEIIHPLSKLTNHSQSPIEIRDNQPAVAAAPDGRIAVLWLRTAWNDNDQFNDNLYFAILNKLGHPIYGPINLTNNNVWGRWNELNVPSFSSPHIEATGDDRFVMAWEQDYMANDGHVDDVYYAVYDGSGNEIKAVTQFTHDTPGWSEGFYEPNLARLDGNQALLLWEQDSNGTIQYAVLDHAGSVIKEPVTLSTPYGWSWAPDAVQLSSGQIFVAWTGNEAINFAVLNRQYNFVAGPTELSNPAALTGNNYVSVAADDAGRAILTWMDANWSYRHNLYYALVDGSGNVWTRPMIFRTSRTGDPYIFTNFEGYGNTSYSWKPPADVDGVADFRSSLAGGPPGGGAGVGVGYANHGETTAANPTLTATLADGLSYVSDDSGLTPTVSGQDVTWNLPDLEFLESREFMLYVQLPADAAYGARYPITATLTSDGPEANVDDNSDSTEVMAARQIFMPLDFNGE